MDVYNLEDDLEIMVNWNMVYYTMSRVLFGKKWYESIGIDIDILILITTIQIVLKKNIEYVMLFRFKKNIKIVLEKRKKIKINNFIKKRYDIWKI